MTKAEELAVLDAAIAKLGTDSYIGPWLRDCRHEIEQSITSDLPPVCSWKEHYGLQTLQMQNVKAQAAAFIEQAKATAKAEADKETKRIKDTLADAVARLNRASKVLADDWGRYA